MVDRPAKLVLFVSVAEADDSPAPTLRSSLLSPLVPLPLILGNSLPNAFYHMVAGFHPLAILSCSLNYKRLHYLPWGILTIHHS